MNFCGWGFFEAQRLFKINGPQEVVTEHCMYAKNISQFILHVYFKNLNVRNAHGNQQKKQYRGVVQRVNNA